MTRILRRPGLATAAVLAACVLSGCGAHPGAAAIVGSDTIKESDLDEVALALCSAEAANSQAGASQDLAGRAARQGALSVLINAALSRQYGEANGVEPDQAQVAAALAANQGVIDKLPASRRTVFNDVVRDAVEGNLVILAVGRSELQKRGAKNIGEEQAFAVGTSVRDAWVKKRLKVSVDPRFGRFSGGALAYRSGSLSAPVSSGAAAGAKAAPDASWTAALPAAQKCT
jgi:hypothetical protein